MDKDIVISEEKEYRLGVVPASSPHDVIVQASKIARELSGIVRLQRLFRDINGRRFVFVEGWSTMGAMLGVLPREKSVSRLDDGSYEANVELIRVTDGMVIGGASARCGVDEQSWARRDEYARRSMAITRATSKAYRLGFSWIMVLAGYEGTPAEEMPIEGEHREIQPSTSKSTSPSRNEVVILKELGFDTNQPQSEHKQSSRPLSPDDLVDLMKKKAAGYSGKKATDKQRRFFASMIGQASMGDDGRRHLLQKFLFGAESARNIADEFILAGLDWLKPVQDSGGAFVIDGYAAQEADNILAEYTRGLFNSDENGEKEDGREEI